MIHGNTGPLNFSICDDYYWESAAEISVDFNNVNVWDFLTPINSKTHVSVSIIVWIKRAWLLLRSRYNSTMFIRSRIVCLGCLYSNACLLVFIHLLNVSDLTSKPTWRFRVTYCLLCVLLQQTYPSIGWNRRRSPLHRRIDVPTSLAALPTSQIQRTLL